jgi:hypothetical protein
MPRIKIALVACAAIVLSVAALALVSAFPPSQFNFYPKCMMYQWTGLHCPGCGGTRAVHELSQGRFLEAIRMNALVILFLPVLIAALVWQYIAHGSKKPFFQLVTGPKSAWALAILVIGFGVLRNIPIVPFTWLAPISQTQTQIQTGSQTKQ